VSAVTQADLAKLTPEERSAFTVAAKMVARDDNPGIGTTATLVLAIQRLITTEPVVAEGNGPLLDPDCKAGKCGSCVGGLCEHECHRTAAGS
jgi:hypothetical protein